MDISPHPIYLGVFIGFVILMLGVGILIARRNKTGEDFLLAGRNLSTPLLLATTLATLVGTGSSLGAVGFGYENGWAGALYGIGGATAGSGARADRCGDHGPGGSVLACSS